MAGTIRIVGLGPGDPGMRTLSAQRCLDAATRIILRTAIHPGLEDLTPDSRVTTCDDLYDQGSSFEGVYTSIADRVMDVARDRDVVYAVPGHPWFGERAVRLISVAATDEGIPVETITGVSALDVMATSLGVDPLAEEVQCVDALAFEANDANAEALVIDPYRSAFISQLYAARIASAAKIALTDLYPEEHPITLVRAAGVPGEERITVCPLHELDHQPVDHLTSAWIPGVEPSAATRHWATLTALVARLRAPDGCPWDRAQTHESLRNAVLDEAYEVVDAIDAADIDNLAEELGDLLLVIAMQGQIAHELDEFSIRDSLDSVNTKLVRRHPHVFGDLQLNSPDEVLQTWRGIKAAEREARGEPAKSDDPIERLPRSMPALLKAAKVLAKNPYDGAVIQQASDPGQRLLDVVGEIVTAGDDPETVLLNALKQHVANEKKRSVV